MANRIPSTCLVLLLAACAGPPPSAPDSAVQDVVRDPEGFEADPPGQWFDGDLHVHATGASNDTGGDSTPAAIAKVAQARGLHFVVLTDHSNSTGSDAGTTKEDPALYNHGPEFPFWDTAAGLGVPGKFLMIDGNELSPVSLLEDGDKKIPEGGKLAQRGHVGCIPKDLATFDRQTAFVDRPPGAVTGGQVLQQARDRGCFTIVNHPYGFGIWIQYDWTDLGYDAIEVWNGGAGYDATDEKAMNTWRCDLLQGKPTVAIGASDNHRVHLPEPMVADDPLNPRLGWPRTAVWAETLTWPHLMAGLQAGRTVLHEGQSLARLDAYDAGKRRVAGKGATWLRLRGKLDPAATGPVTLELRHATACTDARGKGRQPGQPVPPPPTLTDTVLWQGPVQPGATFDVQHAFAGEPGVYTAILRPDADGRFAALSQAVVVAN